MTTVRSSDPSLDETAAMAAESMVAWLRDFDGYRGLVVLSSGDAERAHIVTFWATREALDQSARSRAEVRGQLIETAGAELEGVEAYAVVHLDGFE